MAMAMKKGARGFPLCLWKPLAEGREGFQGDPGLK